MLPKTKCLSGEEFRWDEDLGFEIRVAWSYRLKAFARCRKVSVKTFESLEVVRALSSNCTPTYALQLRKITKPQWMYLEVSRHSSFCRLDCLDWPADVEASDDFGQRSVGTSTLQTAELGGFSHN